MSSSTRGKVREELEGIHTNLDWARYHATKICVLVGDRRPDITELMEQFARLMQELDTMLAEVYSRI